MCDVWDYSLFLFREDGNFREMGEIAQAVAAIRLRRGVLEVCFGDDWSGLDRIICESP